MVVQSFRVTVSRKRIRDSSDAASLESGTLGPWQTTRAHWGDHAAKMLGSPSFAPLTTCLLRTAMPR